MTAEVKHEATLSAEFDHGTTIPDLRRPNFGDNDSDIS